MKKNVFVKGGIRFYVRKISAVVLIILGIIGLFLPFLQGIAMIFAGIALWGGKPAVRRCVHMLRRVRNLWRRSH